MIRRPQLLAAGVAVLALFAVAAVARSSSSSPFRTLPPQAHNGNDVIITPPSLPTLTQSARPAPPTGHSAAGGSEQWIRTLLVVLVVLAIALVVALLVRRRWSGLHVHRRPPGQDPAVLLPPDAAAQPDVPVQLTDAVDAGLGELDRGPVADAIIACWVRVESAAADAGLTVLPSETSAELVDRVLGSYGADERELRRLAALYREARFSSHTMGEHSRAAARECLTAILNDLGGVRAAH